MCVYICVSLTQLTCIQVDSLVTTVIQSKVNIAYNMIMTGAHEKSEQQASEEFVIYSNSMLEFVNKIAPTMRWWRHRHHQLAVASKLAF